jgi:hypothetical protein
MIMGNIFEHKLESQAKCSSGRAGLNSKILAHVDLYCEHCNW